MDLSIIMSILEKCSSRVPKKCKQLDLIFENFYKSITTYKKGILEDCINEVLNILLANNDHNKGLYDLKELEFQNLTKKDKKDLSEIVKFADLLVDYENLSKSYRATYRQKETLLNQINQQREVCRQIYLKRINNK